MSPIAHNIRHLAHNMRHNAIDIRHLAFDSRHHAHDSRHLAIDIRHNAFDTRHHAIDIRHHALDTRHYAHNMRHHAHSTTTTGPQLLHAPATFFQNKFQNHQNQNNMTNRQNAKNEMFKRMLLFFAKAENAAIWVAFILLKDKIIAFKDLNTELDKKIATQAKSTTGITGQKAEYLKDVLDILVPAARKARVVAKDLGNLILAAALNVEYEDFEGIAEDIIKARLTNVRNALNDNIALFAGVNVLPATITDIDAAGLLFTNAIGTPGAAIDEREGATEGIAKDLDTGTEILEDIDDLLIPEYKTSHPEMVDAYRGARKINDIGIHHTGISYDVTDAANNPLNEVTVTIPQRDKTGTTDLLGHGSIIKVKSGLVQVIFAKAGFVTQTLTLRLERGRILNLSIKLIAA